MVTLLYFGNTTQFLARVHVTREDKKVMDLIESYLTKWHPHFEQITFDKTGLRLVSWIVLNVLGN